MLKVFIQGRFILCFPAFFSAWVELPNLLFISPISLMCVCFHYKYLKNHFRDELKYFDMPVVWVVFWILVWWVNIPSLAQIITIFTSRWSPTQLYVILIRVPVFIWKSKYHDGNWLYYRLLLKVMCGQWRREPFLKIKHSCLLTVIINIHSAWKNIFEVYNGSCVF